MAMIIGSAKSDELTSPSCSGDSSGLAHAQTFDRWLGLGPNQTERPEEAGRSELTSSIKMYRQFSRLQDLKAAQNLVVFIAVKWKSFKCLSTSWLNRDETFNKTFAFNFVHVKFALPTDYFVRKESGMEPCKFAGKIHVVKNEGEEQRLVQEGVVCKDFERQDALGMDLEYFNESPLQRICLIQLASKENAVLWMCNEGTFRHKLPSYLLSIITSNVLKVSLWIVLDIFWKIIWKLILISHDLHWAISSNICTPALNFIPLEK